MGSFGGSSGPSLEQPPVATGRTDIFAPPKEAEGALPLGDWLVYPTAFLGGVYDTNITQSQNAHGSAGFRATPSLLAERDNGITKLTVYGMADSRIYTNSNSESSDASNTVAARTGVIGTYIPLPDLFLTAQGDYTRQQDLFSTFGIDHSVTSLNPTGVGLAPSANPVAYNQFTGSASVQKNFVNSFVTFSGSVVDIDYDSSAGAPSANGMTYTGTVRGGYWFMPALYAYVEGSGDRRNYDTTTLNSSGYRATVGIGSDQIGLFKGEVYAGYQAETYDTASLGTTGSPAFGGRIYYYVLPELTLSGSVDETIGNSLLAPSSTSSAGSSTKVTSVLGQANYSIAPEWSASGRAGYIHTNYVGTAFDADAWTVGSTVTYSVWRNLGLTLDYQHVEQSSNLPLQSFSRDVVTLGISYQY